MINKILIGVIAVLLGLGYFSYKEYKSVQADLITSQVNSSVMTSIAKSNQETIEQLQADYAKIERDYNELSADFAVMRMQRDELIEKFEKHDLYTLALSKPILVQKIINSATAEANRCLEILTGQPRKQNETNNECPWLFDGVAQ